MLCNTRISTFLMCVYRYSVSFTGIAFIHTEVSAWFRGVFIYVMLTVWRHPLLQASLRPRPLKSRLISLLPCARSALKRRRMVLLDARELDALSLYHSMICSCRCVGTLLLFEMFALSGRAAESTCVWPLWLQHARKRWRCHKHGMQATCAQQGDLAGVTRVRQRQPF